MLRIMPGQAAMNPGAPRPVTLFRRLFGMLSDWLIVSIGGATFVFIYPVAVPDRSHIDHSIDTFLLVLAGPLLLAAAQLVCTLSTGRTIGETVVRLEPRPPAHVAARLIRWIAGIGGYTILTVIDVPILSSLLAIYVVVSIVLVMTTRHHRGLTYLLIRWEIQDDRVEPSENVPLRSDRTTGKA